MVHIGVNVAMDMLAMVSTAEVLHKAKVVRNTKIKKRLGLDACWRVLDLVLCSMTLHQLSGM